MVSRETLLCYNAVMKDQWISVEDRLPVKGLWLVYGSSETSPPTMRVDEYDSEWGWTGPLEVTHWRELPLPPEFGSISFAGIELASSTLCVSNVDDCQELITWPKPAVLTCKLSADGGQSIHDFMAEAKWQQLCRRELSPMFGWIPMPVAYVTVDGVRVPVEEIGPLQSDGDSAEVTFTVWRHWS
jgi:hypothetical protein